MPRASSRHPLIRDTVSPPPAVFYCDCIGVTAQGDGARVHPFQSSGGIGLGSPTLGFTNQGGDTRDSLSSWLLCPATAICLVVGGSSPCSALHPSTSRILAKPSSCSSTWPPRCITEGAFFYAPGLVEGSQRARKMAIAAAERPRHVTASRRCPSSSSHFAGACSRTMPHCDPAPQHHRDAGRISSCMQGVNGSLPKLQ